MVSGVENVESGPPPVVGLSTSVTENPRVVDFVARVEPIRPLNLTDAIERNGVLRKSADSRRMRSDSKMME